MVDKDGVIAKVDCGVVGEVDGRPGEDEETKQGSGQDQKSDYTIQSIPRLTQIFALGSATVSTSQQ